MSIFPLTFRVQISPGTDPSSDPAGWVWTDITSWARAGITITRGRRDGDATVQPSRCELQLDNAGGRFTPWHPLSPWYGLLRRNCPLRVQVSVGGVWYTRFSGFIDELPVRWAPGETVSWVDVTASGILRRLARYDAVGRGTLYRYISRSTGLVRTSLIAYWPGEDGSSATSAAPDLVTGVAPMWTGGSVRFGSAAPASGVTALVDTTGGGYLGAVIPGTASTSWTVACVAYWPTSGAVSGRTRVLSWLTPGGSIGAWNIVANTTGTSLEGFTASVGGVQLVGIATATRYDDGQVHVIRVESSSSGGTLFCALYIDGALIGTDTEVAAPTSPTYLRVNPDSTSGAGMPLVGHVGIWGATSATSALYSAALGYAGDPASLRMSSISAEESVPFSVDSTAVGSSEPLGPQPIGAYLDIVRDAERTDGGILHESTAGKLTYVRRLSRYNRAVALTLDHRLGDLAPPLEPTDDDQRLRNDVTARTKSGTMARAEDAAHVVAEGRYEGSIEVNPLNELRLADLAAWQVRLGTTTGMRYPQVSLNLASARGEALVPSWLATDIGARICITNPPVELPPGPIDLVLEGYAERLDAVAWTATANCSPASPWTVGVRDTDRRDTAGSQLAGAVTSSATSMLVETTTGPSWVTGPVAIDLAVGGERVTVSAIAAAISDTFGRTTSSGWGTATSGQSWTTSGGSASDFATTGTTGTHTLGGSANVARDSRIALGADYVDITVGSVAISAAATGAAMEQVVLARYVDASNFVDVRIFRPTAGSSTMAIRQMVAGVETVSSFPAIAGSTSASTLAVRLQAQGGTLRGKAWLAAGSEPVGWLAELTVTHLSAGDVVIRSLREPGNTNTSPVATYDDITVANPQTMTVTRSVNGVSKAQSSGTSVRLWQPAIRAL